MELKQSNRLVVSWNIESDKQSIQFVDGIDAVYLNSYLVNEFVVRLSSLLAPTQSLWVTFKNGVSNPTVQLKPALLAERRITAANSTEYYMILPPDVLAIAGAWDFSLEIREIPDSANPTVYSAILTSAIESFTVNNSLAGATGGAPTELDILGLYNTAQSAAAQAGNSATDAAASAKEAQEAAQDVIAGDHAPYIGANGNWYEYSKEQQAYVDSGVPAQGPQGPIQDLSDYATKEDVATAIANAITKALNTPV